MARYSCGARTTNAPTSTLPGISLYSNGSVRVVLREVWITNTTLTQCEVALQRITTAGTQGTGLTEMPYNASSPAATATGFQSHTSTGPTLTTGFLMLSFLGAAYGSGTVWSFGDEGIIIPATSNNGIGITCPNGTGQICDVTFVWDE